MRSIARLRVALLLSVSAAVACGGDDAEPVGISGGGAPDSSAGGGSDSGSGGNQDAAAPNARDAGRDAQSPADGDAGPTLDLEIPMAIVECNGTPCNTLDNVCCESWTQNMGFGGPPSCIPLDQCTKKYSPSPIGTSNRAVVHECDDKEDCSGGQVCCMYAYNGPLCFGFDSAACLANINGPGASRICADNAGCSFEDPQFIGMGLPLGVLSCTSDTDCEDWPGTSCQPEEDNSLTTGKNVAGRSYVQVCR